MPSHSHHIYVAGVGAAISLHSEGRETDQVSHYYSRAWLRVDAGLGKTTQENLGHIAMTSLFQA